MFNEGSLLRVTAQDIVNGMNQDGLGSLADAVCTHVPRPALSGTEPRRDTKDTLNRDKGGRAPGVDPRYRSHELNSDNYDMLQYDDGFRLTDQQVVDLEQYMKPLEDFLATSRGDVNTQLDSDLQGLLGAETQTQAAANGAWSVSSSTPLLDIQEGIRLKCPGALRNPQDYVGVVGITSTFELSRHSNLRDTVAHFAGGGGLDIDEEFGALRGALAAKTGVPASNWFCAAQFYDSNAQGLAVSLAFLFGDFFWFGKKSHLKLIEQPRVQGRSDMPSDFGTVYVDKDANRTKVSYMRTAAILRQDDAVAFRMTGL